MVRNVRISNRFLNTDSRELSMHISIRSLCLFSAAIACAPNASAVEGDHDPSFNGGQVLSVPIPYNNTTDDAPKLMDLSKLSNGAFLAAVRYGTYPSYTVRLIKILANGTLAPTFGSNGVRDGADARIDWGAMATLPGPDTIILAGSTVVPGSSNSAYSFHVVRLDSGGSVDSTFNGNTGYNDTSPGSVHSGVYDYVHAVTVLPSTGQILVAGTVAPLPNSNNTGMGVQRLNGNGTTDLSFGSATYAFPLTGATDVAAYALTVDNNFRILLAGSFGVGTAHPGFAAVRFTSTGAVDSCTVSSTTGPCAYTHSFTSSNGGYASDIRVDQTGKIYVIGTNNFGTSPGAQKNSILRMTDQFALDTTFNPSAGSESFFIQSGSTSESDEPPSAVVDVKNRLMVTSADAFVGIARFLPSGAYDGTYNNHSTSAGTVIAEPYNGTDYPADRPRILLDGDRPVIAAITTPQVQSSYTLKITRLLGDKIFSNGFQ